MPDNINPRAQPAADISGQSFWGKLCAIARPGGRLPAIRWLAVGVAFLGINTALLYGLVGLARISVPVATLIAAEFATIVRYYINDHWVFGQPHLSWKRLLQYHIANAGGFAVWWSATNGLVWSGWHYLAASVMAVAASTGFSFVSNFYWVWHKRRAHPTP